MYRNQQNLYPRIPTAITKLLQYSGLGSNLGMGFLHAKGVTVDWKLCFHFGFGVSCKNSEADGLKNRNCMEIKCKRNP